MVYINFNHKKNCIQFPVHVNYMKNFYFSFFLFSFLFCFWAFLFFFCFWAFLFFFCFWTFFFLFCFYRVRVWDWRCNRVSTTHRQTLALGRCRQSDSPLASTLHTNLPFDHLPSAETPRCRSYASTPGP